MLQILYKYLILNKKASVPGLGEFYIHRRPASLDFANKSFISPSTQIAFTQGDVIADNRFYFFISKEQHITDTEAVNKFDEFAERLTNNLKTTGSIQLPGIGLLSKDGSGKLNFQPVTPIASFYPNVAAERIVREVSDDIPVVETNKQDNLQTDVQNTEVAISENKKDYWWVFAIILAGVAIAAIIYYYNQNGNLR